MRMAKTALRTMGPHTIVTPFHDCQGKAVYVSQPLAASPVLNQTWALDFANDEDNGERLRWRNRSFLTSGVLIFQTQPSMK